jgi:DNA polymerase-3 subunit delta'
MYKKIKGQARSIELLKRAVRTNKVAQSYLFYGPEGVGKFTTALYFAMSLNCLAEIDNRPCGFCASCKKYLSFSHPDFVYIFPTPNFNLSTSGEIKDEKLIKEYENFIQNKQHSPWKEFFFSQNVEIRINNIRMLEQRLHLSPNEGNYKTYLIEQADLMNIQASNAFLKTLEEPPRDSVIILTTSKPNALLPTILSRCQKIPFSALSRTTIEEVLVETKFLKPLEAKIYSRIANNNMEKALRLSDEGVLVSRQDTLKLIRIILTQSSYDFLEFSEEFRDSKSQHLLSEVISHLVIWLADLAYLENEPEQIVNLDNSELLEECYHRNPYVNTYVKDMLAFLEVIQKRLDGHVNLQLILFEIYHRLTEIFHTSNNTLKEYSL